MHAILSYCGNRPTNKQTKPQTHKQTGAITIHCAAKLSARVMKKRSERRKHCALAVVKRSQTFRPAADHLPGGAGRPKFNQLEMVTTFTYKPSWVRVDACNLEVIVVTDPRRPPVRHRQDQLQYTAPQLARSVINIQTIFSHLQPAHVDRSPTNFA